MAGPAISQEALEEIVDALSAPPGAGFFRTLVARAGTALGARAVIVAEVSGAPRGRLRPLAAWRDGAAVDVPELLTAGSPFERVRDGVACLAGREGSRDFAMPGFVTDDMRWFHGVPVADAEGEVLGVLAAMYEEAPGARSGAEKLLKMLAMQAAGELVRARAERSSWDTELRYRLLVEDSFDLVAELDGDRYVYVSPGYKSVLGHEPEEMLGVNALEFVHPDDRPALVAEGRRMIKDHAPGRFRVRLRHRDGSWHLLDSAGRSFKTADGNIRTVIFTKDASAQHQAEEARRDAEDLFRATLESTFDGILVTRIGQEMLYWNQKFAEMLAIPEDVLRSGRVPDLIRYLGTLVADSEGFARAIADLPLDRPASLGVIQGIEGRRFDVYTHPLTGEETATRRVWSIREVTEQTAASAALTASEERFRSLASAAPVGIYVTDTAGLCTYTNPRWQEIAGISAAEALGEGWVQAIHPDDAAEVFAAWEAAVREERELTVETRFRRPDGSVRWVRSHASVTRSDTGELLGYVGTNEDVTERRQAEDALRASEARLRTIVNNAPIVLVALDVERRLVLAEGKGLKELGVEAGELVGRSAEEVFGHRADIIGGVGRAYAGEDVDAVVPLGERTFDAHYSPTRDDDGNITGVVGVAIDVTEQTRTAAALRQSEETAQALLNAPTDGAILVDRAGTIHAINNTARRRLRGHALELGRDDGDFIGSSVYDLLPQDIRTERKERNNVVFATGEPARYEDEREGTWIDTTIDPIFGAEGSVDRLAIFTRDITERKRAEDALREHAVELEQLNQDLAQATDELRRAQDEVNEKSDQLEQMLEAERDRARTDPLTGTLNHGAIREALQELFEAGVDGFAIAMVDVDGMKSVNDTYGHQAGDMVLLEVTRAITQRGAIAGRYGGDEFLVVLPYADAAAAGSYRETVMAALDAARVIDPDTGASVPVVASAGIALYPGDGATGAELVEQADERMYREKHARRASSAPSLSSSRGSGDERTAKMVGALVPLLTAAGTLDERLRLVSHRLSAEAGYDGVNFDVFMDAEEQRPGESGVANQNAFVKASDDLVDAWNDEQRTVVDHPIGQILEETRQPVLLDDLATDPRLTETQRTVLSTIGLISGIAVPMIHRGVNIGTLSAGSKRAGFFTPREGEFLMAVGGQIAAIIHMARLVEQGSGGQERLAA